MSGLEYLLGEPIDRFPEGRLPTVNEVLCFYSQYWRVRGSDSMKEKIVAQELIRVYGTENLPNLSEKRIKNKIEKIVTNLKKILKFKTKAKTAVNIESEAAFRSQLQNTFQIYHSPQSFNDDINEVNVEDTQENMEIDNDGKYFNNVSILSGKFVKIQTKIVK